MAEFIEVARAKRRMCKAHTEECSYCKLQEHCSLLNVCAYSDDDVIKLENEVMSWAAEHPEPVYPTWGDYITMIMLEDITHRNDNNPQTLGQWMNKTHIPDDIAQKLGIGLKEG